MDSIKRVRAWLRQPAPGWMILFIPAAWIIIAVIMVLVD